MSDNDLQDDAIPRTKAMSGKNPSTTRQMVGPASQPNPSEQSATRVMGGVPSTRPIGDRADSRSPSGPEATSLLPARFRLSTSLGGGGEADAYLCEDLDANNELVVVKRYRPFVAPDLDVLEKLKTIAHTHLVRVLHFERWDNVVIEVDQYLEYGTLQGQRIDPAGLERSVLPGLADAIAYCHRLSILHRDIKPSNVFWLNRKRTAVALGDFGLTETAFDVTHQDARRNWMSPLYAPPEAFAAAMADDGVAMMVSPAFDYYGLGMTLLVLLRGSEPTEDFADRSRLGELKLHNMVPLPEGLSERWVTLLRGLLLADRRQRWGAQELERWLRGETVPLPVLQPYRPGFRYRLSPILPEAETTEELAQQLIKHPDEAADDLEAGKGHVPVLIKVLWDYFAPFDQPKAAQLQGIPLRTPSVDSAILETALVLDPSLPYPLTPDLLAATPQELAQLIDANGVSWSLGRTQLFNGRVGVWLRCTGRAALLDEWSRERDNYQPSLLHDAGLERFLHILDPSLDPPTLEVNPATIHWQPALGDDAPSTVLTITNPGRGYLSGNLVLLDPPGWLTVAETDTSFGVFAGAIETAGSNGNPVASTFTVRAVTAGLQRNVLYKHSLGLNANRPDQTRVLIRLIERVPRAIVGWLALASGMAFGLAFALCRASFTDSGTYTHLSWLYGRYPSFVSLFEKPDPGLAWFPVILGLMLAAVEYLRRESSSQRS